MLELKDGFVFYHGSLETHIFENADVDWLHCIAAHRKKKMFIEVEREMAKYDIIAGKIADDATKTIVKDKQLNWKDSKTYDNHGRELTLTYKGDERVQERTYRHPRRH